MSEGKKIVVTDVHAEVCETTNRGRGCVEISVKGIKRRGHVTFYRQPQEFGCAGMELQAIGMQPDQFTTELFVDAFYETDTGHQKRIVKRKLDDSHVDIYRTDADGLIEGVGDSIVTLWMNDT